MLAARQSRHHTQAPQLATWTHSHIDCGHPRHERLGRLGGLCIGTRHLKRPACSGQLVRLASRCQHPVVANALDPRGQHMQQETPDKLKPIQAHSAFASVFASVFAARTVTTHRKDHLLAGDAANALIANGRAVRVAAQILQHLGRAADSAGHAETQTPKGCALAAVRPRGPCDEEYCHRPVRHLLHRLKVIRAHRSPAFKVSALAGAVAALAQKHW